MAPPEELGTLQIRRYPNRRYYDSTRSQHVTLEEIHQLIREGHSVEVTDSKSGEDLTGKVLTQIILEYDTPKLDVFPVGLLHQVIRSSEPLVSQFVEKYVNHAFEAFSDSQQKFQDFLRDSLGLGGPFTANRLWPPFMLGPIANEMFTKTEHADDAESSAPDGANGGELQQQLNQLQLQLEALRNQVQQRDSS
jgi:polyhydroxyalkanoate synthesis repressor PhaR